MFSKLAEKRFKKEYLAYFSRVLKSYGGDSNNISELDKLVVSILVTPLMNMPTSTSKTGRKLKKHYPLIFENKYVQTDAALLSSFLFYKRHEELNSKYLGYLDCKFEFETMLQCGAQELYKISPEDYSQMESDRSFYFTDILDDPDLSDENYEAEAALLFTSDYLNNKFMEFDEKSPAYLLDPLVQSFIEVQTKTYFSIIRDKINNYFHE